MKKVIQARLELGDVRAAEEILAVLQAPVTNDNIINLKVIIQELGELYEAAYNKMLIDSTNSRLASYSTSCVCGKAIRIDIETSEVITPTFSSCGKH